ncbi:hypothetical protein J6590_058683 [Homalodisca vitripennis]|nr:hypothetical protein J6590_058683 [Homalodisca vitripennis]
MNSYIANSRIAEARPKKPHNQRPESSKAYQKNKKEKFRQKKCEEVVSMPRLKRALLCGLEIIEDAIKTRKLIEFLKNVLNRAVRRLDHIYIPNEYADIIVNAKKTPPKFEVKEVKNDDILNFHEWWPHYFKKSSADVQGRKEKFTISKYRHLVYTSDGCVRACEFINGINYLTFRLSKGHDNIILLPEEKLYTGKTPVNPKKMQDIAKVIQYIPDEHQHFYEEVLRLPTDSAHSDDDE